MTATTIAMPEDLASRSWRSLLRLLAVIAVLVVLAASSFVVGRSTADSGNAKASVVPTPAAPVGDTGACGETVAARHC
jgi:hypothetical protein